MPASAGAAERNSRNASNPPAEAPTPTIRLGTPPGDESARVAGELSAASAVGSEAGSAEFASVWTGPVSPESRPERFLSDICGSFRPNNHDEATMRAQGPALEKRDDPISRDAANENLPAPPPVMLARRQAGCTRPRRVDRLYPSAARD